MNLNKKIPLHDFKGIGFSKIGHFKEVRAKIKELENLNVKLARRGNRLEAIFNSMSDGVTILDRNLNIVFANHVQKNMFPAISLIEQKCRRYFGVFGYVVSRTDHNLPGIMFKLNYYTCMYQAIQLTRKARFHTKRIFKLA